jgi:hypothetical protein
MENGTATGIGFEYETWMPLTDKIEKIFFLWKSE